jgi:hypothetical protein
VIPNPYNQEYREAMTVALTNNLLPSLFNTLFSAGKVGAGQTTQPTMGKNVVAGFSSGGGAAVKAIAANANKIDEAYLFDPFDSSGNGIKSMVASLSAWAAGGTTPHRLCIVWGSNPFPDAQGCASTVSPGTQAAPSAPAPAPAAPAPVPPPKATVVVVPSVDSFYQPSGASPPGDPWWNDSVSSFPAVFVKFLDRNKHQFTIYGGEDPAYSSGSRVTFFQKFLSDLTP